MFGMFGTGKPRSKIGKFLDKHRYTQEELMKMTGINRNTVSKICNDPKYIPSGKTIQKLLKALRKIDSGVNANDFFDM